MGRPIKQTYIGEQVIILDDLDFGWTPDEIETIKQMYDDGATLDEMARRRKNRWNNLDLAADETALLIMHLARTGKVKPRKGGIV